MALILARFGTQLVATIGHPEYTANFDPMMHRCDLNACNSFLVQNFFLEMYFISRSVSQNSCLDAQGTM